MCRDFSCHVSRLAKLPMADFEIPVEKWVLRILPPHLCSSQGKVTCSMAHTSSVVSREDDDGVVEVPAPLQGVHHLHEKIENNK